MFKSQKTFPQAPHTLTDKELAQHALREFPNATGTLAQVLHRFDKIASSGLNECREVLLEPVVSGCPHCGTVLNFAGDVNHKDAS